MTNSKFKSYSWAICLGVLSLQPLTAQATPGSLSQYPLFTAGGSGSNTPANIFFQLDDSGSMDWALLTKQYWTACLYDPQNPAVVGGKTCPSTLQKDGGDYTYSSSSNPSSISDFTSFTSSVYEWRDQAAVHNILYYNPAITYVPWKNGDGTFMANASFTAPKNDPYASAGTSLSGFVFEVWNDGYGYLGDVTHGNLPNAAPSLTAGGTVTIKKVGTITTTTIDKLINRMDGNNGMVDFWDNHSRYVVTTTGMTKTDVSYVPTKTFASSNTVSSGYKVTITNNYTQNLGKTESSAVSAFDATTGLNEWGRTLAQEQQNIANWYQYYRQRINVAKGAIGDVIDGNPAYRYGYNTIWNRAFVTVPPSTTTSTADLIAYNKNLLTNSSTGLYKRAPSSGTPLPNALDRVGKYFKHANTLPSVGNTGTGTTQYADPIIYECQQNFGILFTDGYWNETLSNTSIGDSDGDGKTKTLGDVASYYYKNDLSSSWANKVPTNAFDTANWQHLVTFTVAFGLSGNLLDTNGDGWPDYSNYSNSAFTLAENSNWGNPSTANSGENPDNIDDLWHAAFNAKGLYVSASSPEAVAEGFKQILDNISKRDYQGSASAISFSSATSASTGSVYVGQFTKPISGTWTGDVLSVSKTSPWSAATKMEAQATTTACTVSATAACGATKRRIFTSNTAGTASVPFQWQYLTDAQRADLGTKPNGTISAGTASAPDPEAFARLAYLRGDITQETGKTGAVYNFRSRKVTWADGSVHTNLLGDIVHSDPIYVGKPTGNWPNAAPFPIGVTVTGGNDTSSYDNFKLYKANRPGIVYAGANDGMLHGFYAFGSSAGTEAMAYIPNTLFASGVKDIGLHYLTDSAYSHRYYVDMPSVVNDVFIPTPTDSTRRWHTVLIGGEMAGGRGIFALDITDPNLFAVENTSNAQKIALWEFDNSNDKDMGYSYAIPTIAITNAKKGGYNRWAVVFGNGYNNTGSGEAALFVVFLDANLKDNGGVWTGCTIGTTGVGTSSCSGDPDYIKIMAPVSTDPTATQVTAGINCENTAVYNCNGLSIPQVYSSQQNSLIDRVYAGDLKGNLWAFDLSDTNPTNWKVAYGGTATPKPLFTATYHKASTAGGVPIQQNTVRQPITSRPVVVKNASITLKSNLNMLVLFGTGQYLVEGDPDTTTQQSVYAVWDHGLAAGTTSGTAAAVPLTPVNLVEQTFLSGPFYDSNGNDITSSVRVLSKNPLKYTTAVDSKQGWFINFPANKERLVVDPDIVQDKYFFFNTWVPGETTTVVNQCSTGGSAGGTGYLMNVDLFTGMATSAPIVDVNLDGAVDCKDQAGTTTSAVANSCSTGASTALTSVVGGVLYNQGLPASSTFLNQKRYTAGASYNSGADKAAADAAAAAKAIADASAQAAADAAAAAAAAQAAYDAAVAANASAADIAAKKAARDATAAAAATAAAQAAADLAAYSKAAAIAAQAAVASSQRVKFADPVGRIIGGWRQELRH